MRCEIIQHPQHVEVRVPCDARRWDMVEAVRELVRRDPGKRVPDLWVFADDVDVSYADFEAIVASILELCPAGMMGRRSALVAVSPLQQAQLQMYGDEARRLPFEVRVFADQSAAVAWLTEVR